MRARNLLLVRFEPQEARYGACNLLLVRCGSQEARCAAAPFLIWEPWGMRKQPPLGPYSRPMLRAIWGF